MTFVKNDIINPYSSEIITSRTYATVIDFLIDVYPHGFGENIDLYVNTTKVQVNDFDLALHQEDVIVLLSRPAVPVAFAGAVFAFFANAAISIALSYVIGKLFEPEVPTLEQNITQNNQASAVYNLNSSGNLQKAGGVIPVVYGKVRQYPNMITPAWQRYTGNEEYLYHMLCLGHGKFDIDKLQIDNQDVTNHADVEYKMLTQSQFYNIPYFVPDSDYKMIVNTMSTPSNYELRSAQGTEAMKFLSSKQIIISATGLGLIAGQKLTISDSLYNNKTFQTTTITESGGKTTIGVQEAVINEPQGSFGMVLDELLYNMWLSYSDKRLYELGDNAEFYSAGVLYKIVLRTTDNGYQVHTDKYSSGLQHEIIPYSRAASYSTVEDSEMYSVSDVEFIEVDYVYPGGIYNSNVDTGEFQSRTDTFQIVKYLNGTEVGHLDITNTQDTPEVIRKTYRFNKWSTFDSIGFRRLTPQASKQGDQSDCIVQRVKEIYPYENETHYGDITLLWVKIKATNAISAAGATQVNGWFTRLDKPNTIKDVLSDIYTNDVYGGRLNSSDLVFDNTTEKANCAFDTYSTVWDSMRRVAKAQRYNVYPIGQELQLSYDDVKTQSSALYNESNILQDTLKVQMYFKEENAPSDSVQTSYRSVTDWNLKQEIYPSGGLFPHKIDLFGVTDATVALDMARYLYKQDLYRRKVITFDTDIQGLVPQYLNKIKISHNALLWGQAGQVTYISGTEIGLSEQIGVFEPKLDNGVTPHDILGNQPQVVTFRRPDGSVTETLAFTGVDEYTIDVPGMDPTVIEGGFYTLGTVKEYLVTAVRPKGETVQIECVNYNDDVYA